MGFFYSVWDNPKDFYLTTKNYHVKKRDQIVNRIKGLGMAKVSFALEMIHQMKLEFYVEMFINFAFTTWIT